MMNGMYMRPGMRGSADHARSSWIAASERPSSGYRRFGVLKVRSSYVVRRPCSSFIACSAQDHKQALRRMIYKYAQ